MDEQEKSTEQMAGEFLEENPAFSAAMHQWVIDTLKRVDVDPDEVDVFEEVLHLITRDFETTKAHHDEFFPPEEFERIYNEEFERLRDPETGRASAKDVSDAAWQRALEVYRHHLPQIYGSE